MSRKARKEAREKKYNELKETVTKLITDANNDNNKLIKLLRLVAKDYTCNADILRSATREVLKENFSQEDTQVILDRVFYTANIKEEKGVVDLKTNKKQIDPIDEEIEEEEFLVALVN